MITSEQVHKAIDDGMIDAIQDRAKMAATLLLSESDSDLAHQFRLGLVKLKSAAVDLHAVVDDLRIFPQQGG